MWVYVWPARDATNDRCNLSLILLDITNIGNNGAKDL